MIEYTYEDFNEGIESIYNNVLAVDIPYNRIVGIARGGLIPAVVLSHKLNIPMTSLSWSVVDALEQESIAWLAEDIDAGQRVLLVDDIIDGGRTITEILEDWNKSIYNELDTSRVDIATLWFNTAQDKVMPTFWHKTIDRNEDKRWINFWWEKQ